MIALLKERYFGGGEEMKIHDLMVAVLALPMLIGGAKATTITFDSPGDTAGATVDRYAPAVFQSGVSFAVWVSHPISSRLPMKRCRATSWRQSCSGILSFCVRTSLGWKACLTTRGFRGTSLPGIYRHTAELPRAILTTMDGRSSNGLPN